MNNNNYKCEISEYFKQLDFEYCEKNIEGLLSMPSIDGALIGGASLKATEFSSILSISNSLERTSK